jgi:hypothetical protein
MKKTRSIVYMALGSLGLLAQGPSPKINPRFGPVLLTGPLHWGEEVTVPKVSLNNINAVPLKEYVEFMGRKTHQYWLQYQTIDGEWIEMPAHLYPLSLIKGKVTDWRFSAYLENWRPGRGYRILKNGQVIASQNLEPLSTTEAPSVEVHWLDATHVAWKIRKSEILPRFFIEVTSDAGKTWERTQSLEKTEGVWDLSQKSEGQLLKEESLSSEHKDLKLAPGKVLMRFYIPQRLMMYLIEKELPTVQN